jgi:superfamily II DNA or RNA helicase
MRKQIQDQALLMSLENKKSTLAMCTGSGKSRVSILLSQKLNPKTICLIVPTEKLRDENWKDEFQKWNAIEIYDRMERYCYASIAKIKDKQYDLVIADEAHNITEKNSRFFYDNKIERIIGLTATPPESKEKQKLLEEIAPVSFVYTLEQGVKDGVVAPYEITVIETRLDNKEKTIKAGKKGSYYYITERKKYESLSRFINILRYSGKNETFAILNRMRFLYNLESKTELAKYVLKHVIDPKERTLIFCGSIAQSEILSKHSFHSKTNDDSLNLFKAKKINQLSCVQSLNEGQNLPDVDNGFIVQLNSKQKDLVQRIGRIIRLREGHTAKIWILSVQDTQDEQWVDNALKDFNNVTYINAKNIK